MAGLMSSQPQKGLDELISEDSGVHDASHICLGLIRDTGVLPIEVFERPEGV